MPDDKLLGGVLVALHRIKLITKNFTVHESLEKLHHIKIGTGCLLVPIFIIILILM